MRTFLRIVLVVIFVLAGNIFLSPSSPYSIWKEEIVINLPEMPDVLQGFLGFHGSGPMPPVVIGGGGACQAAINGLTEIKDQLDASAKKAEQQAEECRADMAGVTTLVQDVEERSNAQSTTYFFLGMFVTFVATVLALLLGPKDPRPAG